MIILKKISNKGFVLVETLVVSVFILIIFVLIFRNGIPMIDEYEKYENYDDIDSLYTANLIKDIIKKERNDFNDDYDDEDEEEDDFYTSLIKTMQSGTVDYIDLSKCTDSDGNDVWPDKNLCETIKLRTGITNEDIIFLTYSDPSKIKGKVDSLKNNRRYNEYIDYLNDMYDEELAKDPYMIIVSRTLKGNNPYLDADEMAKYKDYKIVKYGSIGFQ